MTLKVGIVGLGRVGRGVLRTNFIQAAAGRFDIKVICDVMTIDQVAYLLGNDSNYGKPPFSIACDDKHLIINGKPICYERVDRRRGRNGSDSSDNLKQYELDVLFDATGTATLNDFQNIVEQGVARKTLCTWNVAGADLSIVYGVNHMEYDPLRHHVVSASTCTGNAATPLFHVLERHFGVDYARILTIHPVLSEQRVLDGYHTQSQLGRAYANSIVPTATNVAASVALVLPALKKKLDALSYRIPTEIVSTLDITATLSRKTSLDECAELFEDYAENELNGIIECDHGAWGHQKVSIDFMNNPSSAVMLMKHMSLIGGNRLGLSVMHDNEFAYCSRVLDVLGVIDSAGVPD